MIEIFKEGDYIVRTWPSGKTTLGQASKLYKDNEKLYFKSLETYHDEGGVQKNNHYGPATGIYGGVPHRLALSHEIPLIEIYQIY